VLIEKAFLTVACFRVCSRFKRGRDGGRFFAPLRYSSFICNKQISLLSPLRCKSASVAATFETGTDPSFFYVLSMQARQGTDIDLYQISPAQAAAKTRKS